MVGVLLVLAGVATGCGAGGGSRTPAASPAPAASPTVRPDQVCADISQVGQSAADLRHALADQDLGAGAAAWRQFTGAVDDLAAAGRTTGSSTVRALDDLLAQITDGAQSPDTMAGLTAIVSALVLNGPALETAISDARQSLSCR